MQTISPDDAIALVKKYWHIEGAFKELPSYADRNFKVTTADGSYVFKIANPQWSYADLDIENAALMHLVHACPDLALPKVILTVNGDHIVPFNIANGKLCHMRLLTYVEGDVYAHVANRVDVDQHYLQTSLGVAIGKLDLGLSTFSHPRMNRYVDWNISNLPSLKNDITTIEDVALRALVERYTSYFASNELHWKASLPMSVIHNDANDFNVIVANDAMHPTPQVNAIIDFGDMCHYLRIADLAIAMVYALQSIESNEDVCTCMTNIITGYHTHNPLLEEEIKVLYPMIMARLCQSILMAERAYRANPQNAYILVSQQGVRRLIRQLDTMGYQYVHQLFLRAIF
jgi:Ser/Thr protein kinase RdoA (MazF antagonist)